MNMENIIILYRYMDCQYPDGYRLEEFEVIRETEKCYYIIHNNREKRVLKTQGKTTFAVKNKNHALLQYFYRKREQVLLLERQLKASKENKKDVFDKLKNMGYSLRWQKPLYNYFGRDY